MSASNEPIRWLLEERGVTRRSFLKFSSAMAGVLAMPPRFAHSIATALETKPRVPVIWLEGQDCAGNTEGFLRASHPTVAELVLDILSVDYHETIMAAAGTAAEEARAATMAAFPKGYVCVVEGSILVRLVDAGRDLHLTSPGSRLEVSATGDNAVARWNWTPRPNSRV